MQQQGWSLVVDSIGRAGAGIVSALRPIAPLSDARLAELLFQAPSVLAAGLTREVAEGASEILTRAGLETRVLAPEEKVEPGDALHEIALVARDPSRMREILSEVVRLLGVSPDQGRQLLLRSPMVLLGKVSAQTAEACRQRFARLGGEIDVARLDRTVFDVFVGRCSPGERARVRAALVDSGAELAGDPHQPLLAMGLRKDQAENLWHHFSRTGLPLRVISRDFERFDVTLDAAPAGPEMIEYLTASTGMPEKVARKVVAQAPLVLHEEVGFERMSECLETITRLGGKASGHLLAFQAFSLRVERIGDVKKSARMVELLAGYDSQQAAAELRQGIIEGPLTHPQAKWLRWELEQAETRTTRISQA